MTRAACLTGVLVLNLAALLVAPTRGARVVSGLGALLALTLLACARFSGRGSESSWRALPDLERVRTRTITALLAPFILPLLSPWLSPQVAFLRVDGRVLLALAWLVLVVSCSALARRRPSPAREPSALFPGLPLLTGLFMLWTSVLWLAVIWDMGISRLVLEVDRTIIGPCRGDPLTVMFRVWDTRPVADHLFLGWRTPDDFAARTVYTNHVHPYLLLMYGFVKLVQTLAGSTLQVATNVTPFLYILASVLAFAVLVGRSGVVASLERPVGQLALFFGLGFLLTQWRFWTDLYRYNFDTPFHLLAALLVVVWSCRRPPVRDGALLVAAGAFAALSPLYAPILIVAVASWHAGQGELWPRGPARRMLIRLGVVCISAAALSYLLPRLLVAWKGYGGYASSFAFRSGLDGDATYLRNLIQAFVSPCSVNCCGSRPFLDLVFPAFLPLLVCGLWTLGRSAATRARLTSQFIFLTAPYFFSLVVFPQSVSIHPYLYDHLLLTPVVIMGAWCPLLPAVQKRLRGPTLLVYLLGMVGLIMSNLIALAQALARWPW